MSYLLTKRLQGLTAGVREIANGDLSKRTELRTGDEFEQLSRDFDIMTDRLQENILKLEEDVKRQEGFMGAVAHKILELLLMENDTFDMKEVQLDIFLENVKREKLVEFICKKEILCYTIFSELYSLKKK